VAKAAGDLVSALEPGLYRATVRGVADQIVMVTDAEDGWTMTEIARATGHALSDITDARPLIVLDLVSSQVDYLRHALNRWIEWSSLTDEKRTLAGLLGQIEAQTRPTRIPEPGVWGVVEAGIPSHTLRRKFVRLDSPTRSVWVWIDADGSSSARFIWDSLIDPTLIREGLS